MAYRGDNFYCLPRPGRAPNGNEAAAYGLDPDQILPEEPETKDSSIEKRRKVETKIPRVALYIPGPYSTPYLNKFLDLKEDYGPRNVLVYISQYMSDKERVELVEKCIKMSVDMRENEYTKQSVQTALYQIYHSERDSKQSYDIKIEILGTYGFVLGELGKKNEFQERIRLFAAEYALNVASKVVKELDSLQLTKYRMLLDKFDKEAMKLSKMKLDVNNDEEMCYVGHYGSQHIPVNFLESNVNSVLKEIKTFGTKWFNEDSTCVNLLMFIVHNGEKEAILSSLELISRTVQGLMCSRSVYDLVDSKITVGLKKVEVLGVLLLWIYKLLGDENSDRQHYLLPNPGP